MSPHCFDGVARLIISPTQTSPVSLALRQDDAVGGRAACTTRWGKGISMSAWPSAL